jgi:hypothetical protein
MCRLAQQTSSAATPAQRFGKRLVQVEGNSQPSFAFYEFHTSEVFLHCGHCGSKCCGPVLFRLPRPRVCVNVFQGRRAAQIPELGDGVSRG